MNIPQILWGVKNNFGIETVPDRFFGAGAYTKSGNDLHQKGLARETTTAPM